MASRPIFSVGGVAWWYDPDLNGFKSRHGQFRKVSEISLGLDRVIVNPWDVRSREIIAQWETLLRYAEENKPKPKQPKPTPYGPPMPSGMRARFIYLEHEEDGRFYREIGERWGISGVRVGQICVRVRRRIEDQRTKIKMRAPEARIVDLPGDAPYRDVWLTYGVPPDSRMDNFYPVER